MTADNDLFLLEIKISRPQSVIFQRALKRHDPFSTSLGLQRFVLKLFTWRRISAYSSFVPRCTSRGPRIIICAYVRAHRRITALLRGGLSTSSVRQTPYTLHPFALQRVYLLHRVIILSVLEMHCAEGEAPLRLTHFTPAFCELNRIRNA